jgi:hypothetical protein
MCGRGELCVFDGAFQHEVSGQAHGGDSLSGLGVDVCIQPRTFVRFFGRGEATTMRAPHSPIRTPRPARWLQPPSSPTIPRARAPH